jgi:hemoglobin
MSKKSLDERLGGYDAISTVSNDLVDRLQKDAQLGTEEDTTDV